MIVRAEASMQEVEDKTGIIKRFLARGAHVDAIAEAVEEISTLNYRYYEDRRLTELADLIRREAAALKE